MGYKCQAPLCKQTSVYLLRPNWSLLPTPCAGGSGVDGGVAAFTPVSFVLTEGTNTLTVCDVTSRELRSHSLPV